MGTTFLTTEVRYFFIRVDRFCESVLDFFFKVIECRSSYIRGKCDKLISSDLVFSCPFGLLLSTFIDVLLQDFISMLIKHCHGSQEQNQDIDCHLVLQTLPNAVRELLDIKGEICNYLH